MLVTGASDGIVAHTGSAIIIVSDGLPVKGFNENDVRTASSGGK
jgi:hypothetical protein